MELTVNPLRVDVNDVHGLTVTGKVTDMPKVYETDRGFFTKFKTALKWKKNFFKLRQFYFGVNNIDQDR